MREFIEEEIEKAIDLISANHGFEWLLLNGERDNRNRQGGGIISGKEV